MNWKKIFLTSLKITALILIITCILFGIYLGIISHSKGESCDSFISAGGCSNLLDYIFYGLKTSVLMFLLLTFFPISIYVGPLYVVVFMCVYLKAKHTSSKQLVE